MGARQCRRRARAQRPKRPIKNGAKIDRGHVQAIWAGGLGAAGPLVSPRYRLFIKSVGRYEDEEPAVASARSNRTDGRTDDRRCPRRREAASRVPNKTKPKAHKLAELRFGFECSGIGIRCTQTGPRGAKRKLLTLASSVCSARIRSGCGCCFSRFSNCWPSSRR